MSTLPASDDRACLRHSVYWLLIALAVGSVTGRILAVNSVDFIRLEAEKNKKKPDPKVVLQRPFLSGNDRSRWCTVRALVEHGTYAIDEVIQEPNWDTIDMVKHDGTGQAAPDPDSGRLYSSKPPLLATLMAAEYWVIHRVTGHTLGTHPYGIGRFMIWTLHVPALVGFFWVLSRFAERAGQTDWGRLFMMASATFGTFLSTFATAINNHLPGAMSAGFAMYAAFRILHDGERRGKYFAAAGLCSAFAFACELPALAFFAALAALLAWTNWRATLVWFAPAAALVLAAYLGTNYAAHGTFRPAYDHRDAANNWYDFKYRRGEKIVDGYWSEAKRAERGPIDRGEPSAATYALHALVGHHGIFSLTPVWLLSAVGLAIWIWRGPPALRLLAAAIGAVSLVCVAFYLLRPLDDRNYGGMTSGFRWAFWFAPLWLAALLPAADGMSRCKWLRGLALVLLAMSVLSAAYPVWNPWTHPWILNFLLDRNLATLGGG